jgi:quercetin dioxygenase-like cupin family protein
MGLTYSRLYSDDASVTHFTDDSMPLREVAPNSGPVEEWVTALQEAQSIGFLRNAAGAHDDWHNAPSKRFVMVISGALEVEAGDGEKRVFTPGTVLLVTDVAGRGHRTRVLGPDDVLLVWVPVP